MDNMTTKRYEMLKRTRDFGIVQATAFPDGSFGKELLATIWWSEVKNGLTRSANSVIHSLLNRTVSVNFSLVLAD